MKYIPTTIRGLRLAGCSRSVPMWTLVIVLILATANVSAAGGDRWKKDRECWKNQRRPYTVEMTALKGKDVTDVFLQVSSLDSEVLVPSRAKNVRVHLSGEKGKCRSSIVRDKNVSLTNGRAHYAVKGLERFQLLEGRMKLKAPCRFGHKWYTDEARVMLRPDLNMQSVYSCKQAMVGQIVNFNLAVQERNNDLGASFDVVLRWGGEELDRVQGAAVSASGSASAVLSHSFTQPGTYVLDLSVEGVTPEDYDTANNSTQVTVVVTGGNTMRYTLDYQNSLYDYDMHVSGNNIPQDWESTEDIETLHYQASMDSRVSFPVEGFSLGVYADGTLGHSETVTNLDITSSWTLGAGEFLSTFEAHQSPLAFGTLYIQSWTGPAGEGTILQVDLLSQNLTYYSRVWNWSWSGLEEFASSTQEGVLLHARQTVQTDVRITDDGTEYGGLSAEAAVQYTLLQYFSVPVQVWPVSVGTETERSEVWTASVSGDISSSSSGPCCCSQP